MPVPASNTSHFSCKTLPRISSNLNTIDTSRRFSGNEVIVNPDHPAIAVAAEVFEESLGRKTVFTRSGGSIPIVGDFAKHLGIPTVLMGFGLPDDGLHSPNEKFKLANYYQGIATVAHFLSRYGA